MSPALKIFLGGLATLALAWMSHTYKGPGFIASLDSQAKAAIAGNGEWSGVTVTFGNSRVAHASGTDNTELRTTIDKRLLEIPGISKVEWGNAPAAPETKG